MGREGKGAGSGCSRSAAFPSLIREPEKKHVSWFRNLPEGAQQPQIHRGGRRHPSGRLRMLHLPCLMAKAEPGERALHVNTNKGPMKRTKGDLPSGLGAAQLSEHYCSIETDANLRELLPCVSGKMQEDMDGLRAPGWLSRLGF